MISGSSKSMSSRATVMIALVLTFAVLYAARDVLIPLALAVLMSFVLAPMVIRLQRIGMPKIPAVSVVVSAAFTVIAAVSWLIATQVADLADMLPRYRRNIVEKLEVVQDKIQRTVDGATEALDSVARDLEEKENKSRAKKQNEDSVGPPDPAAEPDHTVALITPNGRNGEAAPTTSAAEVSKSNPLPVEVSKKYTRIDLLRMAFGPILSPMATAVIVLVLTIFILIQREDLRDRIIRLCGYGRMHLTTELLDEATSRVSRYLMLLILINGITGAAVGLGLTLLGVPNGILWGLIAALLRFVPYVGPWIAALMPIALATAVFDGWKMPLLVIALFLVIELLSNNLLEPWLYGTQTGASPFAVVVSAVFWTWLWGGVGLLLATPLTVCMVVIGKYVPQLGFLHILLGDSPPLEPSVRYYQRLLALDREEADEIVEQALKSSERTKVYDEIVLPALRQAENDRHQGELNERREAFVFESVRGLIEEAGDADLHHDAGGDVAVKPPVKKLRLMCVPARDEADELVAGLLTGLLRNSDVACEVISRRLLVGEIIRTVVREAPDMICVSALPPSTIAHARWICKRLRRELPEIYILVGLWTPSLNQQRAAERLGCGPNLDVVGSLREAVNRISGRARLQPSTATRPPPERDQPRQLTAVQR